MSFRKNLHILLITVCWIVSEFLSFNALAKEVRLEWEPIEKAVKYQVAIETEGKNVTQQIIDETKWTGNLPTGVYTYRIRAIDKVKRAGFWSDPKPLVVLPPPPEIQKPKDGSEFMLYSDKARVSLRWNGEGEKYKIAVKQSGRTIFSKVTTSKQVDLPSLSSGEFTWEITAIMEGGGRSPASQGKRWFSPIYKAGRFTVEKGELEKVVPVYPIGAVAPANGKMTFRWKSVEGAEAYEVRIYPSNELTRGEHRKPALEKKVKSLYTKDTTLTVRFPKEGSYTWDVRALSNISATRVPAAYGPKTSTDFQIDPNASFSAGMGYVALSVMLAPYTYKVVSPALGGEGSFASTLLTLRLSGEYWFHPRYGVSIGAESTNIQVSSKTNQHNNAEAHLKYRVNFSKSIYGWYFNPKLGVEMREYPELLYNTSTSEIDFQTMRTFGPSIGFDIRKLFNKKFSLGAKVQYYFPLTISGDSAGSLSSTASKRNLSAGVQGLYWMSKRLGLGVGAFLDNRSISYTPDDSTSDQQVYLDGVYFFGSLIYNF